MTQNRFNAVGDDDVETEVARSRIEQWTKLEDDLPERITLKGGAQFDPRPMKWSFMVNVTTIAMNFDSLPVQVAPLVLSLKRVLIQAFEENSPKYAENLFGTFRHIAEVIAETTKEPVSEITEWHIANYMGKFALGDKLGRVGQLSALLNRWSDLQYGGVSESAVRLLSKTKKKGNVKGEAVKTLDPVKGPFTDFELQQVISALNSAYALKQIDEQYFYLTWLAIHTGQRVSQYCALKVKDIVRKADAFGDPVYEINIPKAKQRGEVIRDSFLTRALVLQYGESLWNYARKVMNDFPQLKEEAPMFPSQISHRSGYQIGAGFEGHWNSTELSSHFQEALSSIAPVSPRTMAPMNLAIGRFRDTLGTRAAQEGFGELVIAEILGHSDTQNVGAYVAVIPEIAGRLDKLLGDDLAPIANVFMGRVLRHPEEATRANDPTSTIKDYRHSGKGFGSCGTKYDCSFRAPIACYTCLSFEAWLDGPHEKLLAHLEKERERIFATSGPRVAAVNDLTIDAIRAVIRECNRIRSEMGEESVHV